MALKSDWAGGLVRMRLFNINISAIEREVKIKGDEGERVD